MIRFCLALASVALLPHLPSPQWGLLLLVLLIGCLFSARLRVLIPVALGLLWGLASGYWLLAHRLPDAWQGIDLQARGTVVGLPFQRGEQCRFDLALDQLINPQGSLEPVLTPRKIRLTQYRCLRLPQPGQRWLFTVRLKRPHGFLNPNTFDYSLYLLSRSIDASGYVRGDASQQLSDSPLRGRVDRWRASIAAQVGLALTDSTAANASPQRMDTAARLAADQPRLANALIRALVIGDKRGLDDEIWRTLRDTGTAHLFVISGLHIAMVAGFCFAIVHWLGRLVPSFSYRLRQTGAAIAAIAGSGGYAMLAGFGLPTQRAWVMVCAVMLSLIGWRSISASQRLWLAAITVLLIEPLAIRQAGFWLSFGACAVLIVVISGRIVPRGDKDTTTLIRYLSKTGVLVRAQLAIALGLTPWLLLLFAQWSVLSPLINLIAIPLVSMLLPLILVAVLLLFIWPTLGIWLLQWLGLLIEQGWSGLQGLGALVEPWTINASVTMIALLLALVGSLLLLLPQAIPGRWLALLMWLPLTGSMVPDSSVGPDKSALPVVTPVFKTTSNRPEAGAFRATVIDVGQGLSVLIETQHHRLLYDSGPRYRSGFNAARATIVPLLHAQGIRQLERLIISHADSDHSGGQQVIEQQVDVLMTLTGSKRIDADQGCYAGQQWSWDGVRFMFLHPSANPVSAPINRTTPSENNLSCVLLVDNGQQRLLLTGDIEAAVERRLVEQYGSEIKSNVLLASHHGSHSSTSEKFLDQVNPDWFVVSSGWRNRFNHPNPSVIRRVLARGAVVINTAIEGAVFFDFPTNPNQSILMSSELERGWGYWREPMLDRPMTH